MRRTSIDALGALPQERPHHREHADQRHDRAQHRHVLVGERRRPVQVRQEHRARRHRRDRGERPAARRAVAADQQEERAGDAQHQDPLGQRRALRVAAPTRRFRPARGHHAEDLQLGDAVRAVAAGGRQAQVSRAAADRVGGARAQPAAAHRRGLPQRRECRAVDRSLQEVAVVVVGLDERRGDRHLRPQIECHPGLRRRQKAGERRVPEVAVGRERAVGEALGVLGAALEVGGLPRQTVGLLGAVRCRRAATAARERRATSGPHHAYATHPRGHPGGHPKERPASTCR